MKENTKRKWLVLLLALCVTMLLSVFMMNTDLSATYALADSVTSAEDNLTFSLNSDNTGYKVVARNKQITEAIIPAKYNGLPVTEISDNGFMSCTKLTTVWIPYTVTKIGNNAFANCSVLEEVNGMSCVETIGNNAFAMCKALDNLILPYSITSLGSTILRSNPNTVYSRLSESDMRALNANWIMSNESTIVVYGNELVLDEVYNDQQMIGYAINRTQNLNSDVDFVLGDTYNGLPLLEIETWAFGFSSFNTFTLRHGEIVPDVDESVISTYSTVSDDCNHIVNISSGAFIGMDVTDINLLVDVTFYDSTVSGYDYEFENGYSTDIFAYSTVRRIILPNNVTVLPRSVFSGCENLREISNTDANIDVNHLSSNITSIGSDAFTGCKSLINLYIPNSIVNMGNSVFNQWGDSGVMQTIHFDDFYEAPVGYENYNWNVNWLGTTYDNVEVTFKTINVILDKEGGNNGTGSIIGMYNQDMPEAVAPERDYYTFMGYYSERNGQGNQYYDKDMNSVKTWDKQTDTVLYAYWNPYTYTITFDKQGGTGGSDSVNASYEQLMPAATVPEKTVDPEMLLKAYSIVFQDVTLFNNTVMENIRIGKKGATDEEVLRVAREAQCDEFVSKLPDGYNTVIGENGSMLSGGERQRISIARAMLKDAPIVIMDEATASLDAENETQVQTALSALIKDKTVLIIAHRMRTVDGAEKIVVLQGGRVAQQGTPQELKVKGGTYARMSELQSQNA